MLPELSTLFTANASQAKALTAVYQTLVDGVPNIGGYTALIEANNTSNFGAGTGPVFNDENIFINIANSLIAGNATATAKFATLSAGSTLKNQVEALYNALIPVANQTDAGREFMSRPDALAFYTAAAAERGITGDNGPAIIAFASILKVTVDEDLGVGNAVNDLIAAVKDGSAVLPDSGDVFTPIEDADGTKFDTDDAATGSSLTFTNAVGEALVGTSGSDTFNGVGVDSKIDTSTINVGDTVDGAGGVDTLNIIAGGAGALAAGFGSKNVENVFITNGKTSLTTVDSTIFEGAEQLWFTNNATAVKATGLTAAQTIGVKGAAAAKVTGDFGDSKTANVALDGADGAVDLLSSDTSKTGTLNISGDSLVTAGAAKTVTIAGTAVINSSTVNVAAANKLDVDITAATNATTLTVTGSGSAALGTIGAKVKSLDASANTGGVTATGGAAAQELTGGAGKDSFTITATLADKGFIKTGAEADKVDLGANAVSKGAAIDLGEGNDSIIGTGAIDKDATVDGGAGTDTLALSLVGAANIAAFSNFEVFDVNALNGNLDLDILASKNTVTEIVGSGPLAANSTLSNVGAGVDFRATADMNKAATLTLDQKTAGDITVTLDADSTKNIGAGNDNEVKVILEDATSAKIVFDVASADEQVSGGLRNTQEIDIQTKAATTLEITSGGTNADNVLTLSDTSKDATNNSVLTKVTITGDQALDATAITIAQTNKLSEVDASAHTGGLTIDLLDIANGGSVKIGSGTDIIKTTDAIGNTSATVESVVGFEKAASTKAEDTKVADLIDHADNLTVGIEDNAGGNLDIAKGVVTFLGAGPGTLDAAIGFLDTAMTTDHSAAIFEYVGNSYLFISDDTTADAVVKLDGITGVTEIGVTATNDLFIV